MNSVEQNEVFRENQFMTWSMSSSNAGWLVLLLGLPLGFRCEAAAPFLPTSHPRARPNRVRRALTVSHLLARPPGADLYMKELAIRDEVAGRPVHERV